LFLGLTLKKKRNMSTNSVELLSCLCFIYFCLKKESFGKKDNAISTQFVLVSGLKQLVWTVEDFFRE